MSDSMNLPDDEPVIWLNASEAMKLSSRLSAEQMGNVIREICEASEAGVLRNGPLARKDPPVPGELAWKQEATDGTQR